LVVQVPVPASEKSRPEAPWVRTETLPMDPEESKVNTRDAGVLEAPILTEPKSTEEAGGVTDSVRGRSRCALGTAARETEAAHVEKIKAAIRVQRSSEGEDILPPALSRSRLIELALAEACDIRNCNTEKLEF
jgi:hypothetical protein